MAEGSRVPPTGEIAIRARIRARSATLTHLAREVMVVALSC